MTKLNITESGDETVRFQDAATRAARHTPYVNEFTSLHVAAEKGHEQAVKLLIAKGADVKDDGRKLTW